MTCCTIELEFNKAHHCRQVRQWFYNRRVLEIGCGLGLTGLALAASAAPASVVITDCDPEVLRVAEQSIAENGLSDTMSTEIL